MKSYRADIDGLRAVAVLLVVIGHAFPTLLPSGFVGVDIFFVISGFLITSIIVDDLDSGRFSIWKFYARRARRIVPALAVVLLAISIVAFFELWPEELRRLGRHLIGSGTFTINFFLFTESGYFDHSALSKPLLHLWSLGVEEQFYLIWPLTLLFAHRRKWNLKSVSLALFAISFGYNLVAARTNPNAAYYLPMSRLWELLAGCILAIAKNEPSFMRAIHFLDRKQMVNLLSGGAILLLAAALFFIDESKAFPGWWALLPVTSATLFIFAGFGTNAESALTRRILSNRSAVSIGLISYPLYLWHWPMIVGARIFYHGEVGTAQMVFVILISILLAALTYQFMEKPVKIFTHRLKDTTAINRRVATAGFGSLFLFAILGFGFQSDDGLTFRFENSPIKEISTSMRLSMLSKNGNWEQIDQKSCAPFDLTKIGGECFRDLRDSPRFLALGNSKAHALFSGLVQNSDSKSRWILIRKIGCGILESERPDCAKFYDALFEQITANSELKTVLIAFSLREIYDVVPVTDIYSRGDLRDLEKYKRTVSHFVRRIHATGKKAALLIDHPAITNAPELCWLRPHELSTKTSIDNDYCSINWDKHEKFIQPFIDLGNFAAKENPGLIIFDPAQTVCGIDLCRSSQEGFALYSYSDHLSDYGSRLVAADLMKALNQ